MHNSTIGEMCYFVVRRIRQETGWPNLSGPPPAGILMDHFRDMLIDPEQIREKKSAGSNSPVRRNVINIQRVGLCAFYRHC